MEILSGKHIPRRTFLQGMGASVALPFLDAMVPAARTLVRTSPAVAGKTRLVCIESVHGAAGSNAWGATKHLWSPAVVGKKFELIDDSALKPLEAWREYLTIISNTDCRMA